MTEGKTQINKQGSIKYLTNEVLHMEPADLLDIFETHGIARKKLKTELQMFEAGITSTEQYRAEGNKEFYVCRVGDSSNSRRALIPLKTIPFVFLGALSRFRWDYCGERLQNSYPTYFKRLPALVKKINAEKKNSNVR